MIQLEDNTQFAEILCPLFGHYSRFYTLETYLGNNTKFSNNSHVTYVTEKLLLTTCEYVSYTELSIIVNCFIEMQFLLD